MNATSIGVDLSKSVFQVSLSNAAGRVVERKRLSRAQYERFLLQQPPAEIVMEACVTAHHWARTARAHGHDACLLHAQYVRPYVRRNKTDAADADALLRARRDPDLKPIPIKSLDQQALQGLHRIRQQWLGTRTQRINLARGLLAEFGIALPRGAAGPPSGAQRRTVSDLATALGARRRTTHPSQQGHPRLGQQDGAHHLGHLDPFPALQTTLTVPNRCTAS